MKQYVISDTHFSHFNIIRYQNRPFLTAMEMNQKMIDNWNDIVIDQDEIYHLGDFAFNKVSEYSREIFDQLKGKKYLIKGNHDSSFVINKLPWRAVYDYYELKVDGQHIVLFHYPIYSWNRKYHGSIHLHGHEHGNGENCKNRFDLSVELWDYKPVEITKFFPKKDV